MAMDTKELKSFLSYLTPRELAELNQLSAAIQTPLWEPFPGPQTMGYESNADILGYGGSSGGGKALALDTPIPTTSGWVSMGEVREGDTLFDENGQPCRVLYCSEVFINHSCYEVEFSDGAVIVADADHKWLTLTNKDRINTLSRTEEWRAARRAKRPSRAKSSYDKPGAAAKAANAKIVNSKRVHDYKQVSAGSVKTTEEILSTLLTPQGAVNHSVCVAKPLQLPDAELPIPPYTFGAWLGDGASQGGRITCFDLEILAEIQKDGFQITTHNVEGSYGILGLVTLLREQDLIFSKRILPAYLRSSVEQRLALLQGLMDTDGYAKPSGMGEFTTTSPALRDGMVELLATLGIKANACEGVATLDGRVIGPKWRIVFLTELPMFRLPRKLAKQKRDNFRGTHARRYITDIRPVPSRPVRCIQVDSPSRLYLAGKKMIPTHNTDLILGIALLNHKKSIIFRREAVQSRGMMDRLMEITSGQGRLNENFGVWRDGYRQIQFAGIKDTGDENRWKGRPHDFVAFDEADFFAEQQIRFLLGWMRTADTNQRCRCVICFNPPSNPEGRWVSDFFGPWVNKKHPRFPTDPGELRWYAMLPGEDGEVERPNGEPFLHYNEVLKANELIRPMSRTFIPSRVTDNPALMATGYMQTLMSLEEPLRSQLLYGDFNAGIKDDPYQIIPTAWVEAAMDRWTPAGAEQYPLTAVGVDPSRGGSDAFTISRRHRTWFAPLITHRGEDVDDGPKGGRAVMHAIDGRPSVDINIDVIGIGASVYDWLAQLGSKQFTLLAVNFAEAAPGQDRLGLYHFVNMRSWAYWYLRECLDPNTGDNLALPPDRELLVDLTTPRWEMRPGGILLEPKDKIKERIKRSPDRGDAIVYGNLIVPGLNYNGAIVG